MKAQKVDDIKFTIEQDQQDLEFNLVHKEGGLYLSLYNIFVKSDEKWYEIPLEKLYDIEILQKEPPKLRFELPSMKITIRGKYAEKLLALRHLLMPYITDNYERVEPLKEVIKMWGLGITDRTTVSDILKMEEEKVDEYLKEAKDKDLIEGDNLTEEGKKFLNGEKDYLDKLEG